MKKALLVVSFLLNLGLLYYILFETDKKSKGDAQVTKQAEEVIVDEKGLEVNPVNIVMLGNSITYAGDWQKVMSRKDIFNGGKPGWTTQQLSWVIKNFIVPHKPKLCFFKAGINDYTLGITTQRIYENMTMIMDSIRNVGTQPVYTTTLYQRTNHFRNRQIDSLNAKMRSFCSERGYDFMDLRPYLCENGDIRDEFVQGDNTHLTPEAYPEWAKAGQRILDKYGL